MADVRARAVARLPFIINGTLELPEVLARTLEQVEMLVGGERAFVVMMEDGRQQCRAARGIAPSQWKSPRYTLARTITHGVIKDGAPLLTSDAQVHQRPDLARSLGIQSILCAPLIATTHPIGAIFVERRLTLGIFTADDLDLLESIALHCAVAIENAQRFGGAREAGRREGASAVAEAMVLSLLPTEVPVVAGFRIAARWQSAGELSADFYDVFKLSDDERWGVVVADVSDRGPPAALFMALSRSILRASVAGAPCPADGISGANRLILEDARSGRYVLVFFCELSPNGDVTYVNAGQPAPIWWQAARGDCKRLAADSWRLGVRPDLPVRQHTLHLESQDALLIWSDGLTELRSAEGESFGEARLTDLVRRYGDLDAPSLAAALWEEVQHWLRGNAPHDDVILVIVKREEEQPES